MKKNILFFAALFVLIILRFFLIDHGATKALYDFDEARYAEVAKNILKTNSWWVQHANGPDDVKGLYLWKPPLHPIVIALSYKLFGVNELGVRFPTLLFFMGNCVVIFLLAKRLNSKEKLFPYLVTVLFAVFPDNAFLYSQGIAEQQLLFFNLLALYVAMGTTQHRRFMWGGVFWGLALLTKGFAAWWVPILLVLFCLRSKDTHVIKNIAFFVVSGLVVALPWHVYMYSQFGQLFIDNYVLANTVGRSIGAAQNSAPFWWYGAWIIWNWRPLIFLLPLIVKQLKSRNVRLLLWILLILIPFSLIKSKVWWYIFPASIPLILFSAEEMLVNPLLVLFAVVISMLPVWDMGAISIKSQLVLFLLYFGWTLFLNARARVMKGAYHYAIVGVIIISLLFSLRMSLQNGDSNKDLKNILTRSKTTDLSTYKIPYEAALFYSDNGMIKRDDLMSHYVITKKEFVNAIENNYWEIDEQGEWVLMKKIY